MQNLFPYFLDQVNRGLRQAYLSFDSFAGAMSSVHFTLIAIVIIGLGVILMRGKPVHGS